MNSIEVKILNSEDYPLWDRLVEQSQNGTIFHTSHWLSIAGRVSKVNTEFIGAFSHNNLIGGCTIHTYQVGCYFTFATTTLPLTPYGGVILPLNNSTKIREKEKSEWSIIQSIISEIQKSKPHFISLVMSPQVIDIRPYTWEGWETVIRYCYIFPLIGNIEGHISKKVRWSINKSEKLGIVVKQKWDNDIYWQLILNTYHKQKKQPPFSQKLLFSFMENIQENHCGEMWIAETATGDIASAEIITWDQQMAYRWSAASNDQHRETGATSLLLFEIMHHLQDKGFKKFNLMAANTPPLAKFISSFNPELVPYYSVQKKCGIYRIFNTLRSIIRK